LNIVPYLHHNELQNMNLHIENYILSHLKYVVCKLFILCRENTEQIDKKYLNLLLSLRKATEILLPFPDEIQKNLNNLLLSKKITKHWILSKNELFLNRQYNIEERIKECKGEWKGIAGEDHFYVLNQFSVLRKLNITNNPVVSILSGLLKNPNIL